MAPVADREKLLLIVAGGYDARLPDCVRYEAQLQALAKEATPAIPAGQVLFLRNITEAQKHLLLTHMRALVYTPTNEHFGIVPVEAMAYGKPVVAVGQGGPCESVGDLAKEPDAAAGILCEPTAAAFGAAMRRLVTEDALLLQLQQNAARRVQRFSLEAFSQQLGARVLSMTTEALEHMVCVFVEGNSKSEVETKND